MKIIRKDPEPEWAKVSPLEAIDSFVTKIVKAIGGVIGQVLILAIIGALLWFIFSLPPVWIAIIVLFFMVANLSTRSS